MFSILSRDTSVGVQPHGVLIFLRGSERVITSVSANAGRVIGHGAGELIGRRLQEFVGEGGASALERCLAEAWREGGSETRLTWAGGGGSFHLSAGMQRGGDLRVEIEPAAGADAASLKWLRALMMETGRETTNDEWIASLARAVKHFTGYDRVAVEWDAGGECAEIPGTHHFILDAAAPPVRMVGDGAATEVSASHLSSPGAETVRHLAALDVSSRLTVTLRAQDQARLVCDHRRPKYLTPEQRTAVSVAAASIGFRLAAPEVTEERRRFAGVVTHEVGNYLHPALMALSMLRTTAVDRLDGRQIELLEMCQRTLGGLMTFTRELPQVMGAEASGEVGVVDLRAVAEDVVRLLSIAGDEAVKVVVGALPSVVGLQEQMHHVLMNLLRNALAHGRVKDRPLSVEIGHRVDADGSHVVYVRDDGRGVAPGEARSIFSYFYRGGDHQQPGSGIGLAYCAQVILGQGHRIWVEDGAGKGAAFCFTVTTTEAGA